MLLTDAQVQAVLLARVRRLAESGRAAEIRAAARLSLYDIADAIGSNASTVQRWESGERRPHGEQALRYAALLDALENDDEAAASSLVARKGCNGAPRDEA